MTLQNLPQTPSDFAALTLSEIKQLRPSDDDASRNRKYIDGDHLQDGDAWIGPRLKDGDPQHAEFLSALERCFIWKDVITEVCERLVSAVAGREPRWAWVPKRRLSKEKPITDAEKAAIEEMEDAMTVWWDEREIHQALKRILFNLQWGRTAPGRFMITGDDVTGRVRSKDLAEAFARLYLDTPEPEDGFVYTADTTRARLGVFLYQSTEGKEAAEICFLDDRGETVIKILGDDPDNSTLKLGRALTIFQLELKKPLISGQIRSLQNAHNMSLTLLGKNLADNQFLERIFMDVLPPGDWTYKDDGAGNKVKDKFIPYESGRATGGRVDSYMQSVDYEPKRDEQALASGSVTFREPLDPTGAIKGAEYWYQALLEAVRQDHILMNKEATPSGKSRDEARVDFADSGRDTELQAEIAGRTILLTAAHAVEMMTGQVGKWTKDYKPVFKCNARYGKLSVEERNQNLLEVEKGLRAKQTAMSEANIDDTDAELALISMQEDREIDLRKRQAEVAEMWSTFMPRDVALHLAGITEEEVKKVMAMVAKASVEDDPAKRELVPDPAIPKRPSDGGKQPNKKPTSPKGGSASGRRKKPVKA